MLYAVSPAGATGLWQLMKGTAKVYGLKVDNHVDERLDPEKSTLGAAKYLKSLFRIFGNWKLVVMGYNSGEHRIAELHALSKKKGIDILNNKKCPNETYYYLHYFVTILKIVNDPEGYGYDPIIEKPWLSDYTIIETKGKTPLKMLAQKHGVTVAEIKKLNPALLGSSTPPYKYSVRIPAATKFQV
jgi:membrane-bound lytic murein transglycosylase D